MLSLQTELQANLIPGGCTSHCSRLSKFSEHPAQFLLAPGALATNGADFSNNLFTDLGPLLALFGEQVAKQFMSQSMSWLEDVIFAMAPLGIITAITGAVRVGGPIWLKAVVGRARESGAAAEMELMSSTSHQVCELWNGEAIVRVMGSPEIAEILCFESEAGGEGGCKLCTFETAKKEKYLRNDNEPTGDESTQAGQSPPLTAINGGALRTEKKNVFSRILSGTSLRGSPAGPGSARTDAENTAGDKRGTSRPATSESAPNISLNFCEIKRQWELWLFAILGFVLQFGSLVFIGVARYHPRLRLKEEENSEYAYPLMASGTLLLVLGMMACSHVVQASSIEVTWVAKEKNKFRILWLQKSSTVNDQLFGSYALFGDGKRSTLTTSRHRKYIHSTGTPGSKKHTLTASLSFQNLTIAGSFISLVGFVTQFVGIRALHWSAPVAQLGVTLTMTAVRTWIRRNMSARPVARILPKDYEIDWLAVKLGTSPEKLWNFEERRREHDSPEGDEDGDDGLGWEMLTLEGYRGYEDPQKADTGAAVTGAKSVTEDKSMTLSEGILKIREELGILTKWKGLSHPFALELSKCLQSLLSFFVTSRAIVLEKRFMEDEVFQWTLPVKVKLGAQRVVVTARRSRGRGGNWDVSPSELCAIISLWSYGMRKYEQAPEDTPDKDRSSSDHGHGTPTVFRVLGAAKPLLIRDCEWWMDRGGRFVVMEISELEKAESSGGVMDLKTKELPKTIAQINHNTTESSTTSVARHRIVGTKVIDGESLVFASECPLRRMCAQEILSSFMWAIAGAVQSITGKTEPRTAYPPGVHESEPGERLDFKLENAFFQKLADIITESGVTSNNQDAYALIIPPFSDADKLPGVSYVVTETHQKIKNLQQVEKRENITKIKETYIKLFDICNSSGKTHNTTITVTALLMEELCNLNTAEDLHKYRADLEHEGEKARKCLDDIKSRLIEEGDKVTLGALIYLYQKQGRCAEGGGIGKLPGDCAIEIGKTCGFRDPEEQEEKARLELEERARWNPVHRLVTGDGKETISKGDCHLNAADILGWAPLHYAASRVGDQLDLVSNILDAEGQVDLRNKLDYTPLHYAAANGHTQVVSKLCGAGADKDAQNIDLRTPLHLAAEQGHPAATKFLLSKGAKVDALDKYGWTPLHYAAVTGKKDVVEQLLAKSTTDDARENLEMTPLHLAASTGQLDIVNILLGRDPKAAPLDHIGRTPLHLAASSGITKVVEILIKNTGPNVMDHQKTTPLHYAAWGGHSDAVKSLLHKGANPSPVNHTGSTPLHFACQHGHVAVADELLSAGADPTLKRPESRNQTPLEELKANKALPEDQRNELASLLEEYTKTLPASAESSASGTSPKT